jgi:hypothetical protein
MFHGLRRRSIRTAYGMRLADYANSLSRPVDNAHQRRGCEIVGISSGATGGYSGPTGGAIQNDYDLSTNARKNLVKANA